jgi:hypothetical protein
MVKESVMGVKTAKKTLAKKKISSPKPAGGGKKNGSAASPPVRISLGNRVDRLEEAVAVGAERTGAALALLAKQTAASEAMLTRKMAELSERVDKTSATVDETSREVRQTTKDLAESVDKLNRNVGGINNSIGKVVELVLLPGLMEKMNAQFGYQFDNISPNKIFTESGNQYAEVDLFLENGEAVMAVEAKTRVKESEMNAFLKSLNELRQHEVKAGVVGKTIYAAVAGISFDNNARRLAVANGMYLVELDRGNDRITIESPTGAVGKW